MNCRRQLLASIVWVAACTGNCSGLIGDRGQSTTDGTPGGGGSSGSGGSGGPGPTRSTALCTSTATAAGPAPLARLTDVQYRNTVRDLLPGAALDQLTLPAEITTEGFTNNATTQTPSAVLIENLQGNAHALAVAAVADTSKLLPCHPASAADEPACGQQFLQTFGKRAFRRPLRADETTRYSMLFSDAYAQWGFQTALRMTVEALLQSPGFLYRIELGGAAAAGSMAAPLDGYELASRLSYFLTNTMPDAALMSAADAGKLQTPAGLEAEARRLLATSGARAAVANFHAQWLRFDKMDNLVKSADLYPGFGPPVATAMKQATAMYVDHLFWDGGRTLDALLTDGHAYVNDALAPIYGVTAPMGATLALTSVDGTQRSGILTQAGLLAGFAHERSDAPVLRGVFVLDRLLCATPPPPPAGVNTALPEIDASAKLTTRQQLESSHVATACAACHRTIDGAGFGFENFDAVGQWRTTEFGVPVDAHGQLIGTEDVDGTFNGPVELGQKLAGSNQVRRCVATQWLRYALGVTRDQVDGCMVAPIAKAFADARYDLRELLVATIKSDAFRYRPAIAQ